MIVCTAGVRAALAAGLCWASVAAAQDPLAVRPGIAVPWPDTAVPTPNADAAATGAPTPGDVRYTASVTGLDDRLTARFQSDSALIKGRGAIANLAQINRRATEDRDLIDQLLRSLGYYGGRTVTTITPGTTVAVTLAVDPGPLYTVAGIELSGDDTGVVAAALGVKAGDPVAALPIAAAQDGLRRALGTRGYAFATIDPAVITIDHATRTATIAQHVAVGARGRFGQVRIDGPSVLASREVARLARFRADDPYDPALIDDLRRALVATGLIGGVTLTPVAAGPGGDGSVIDIAVHTDTAPLRTVAATAGYSTSQGTRVEASWTHRNLVPPNGAVTFRGIAAERQQLLGSSLRRQNWRRRDTTLTLGVTADTATQDAFNARTLAVFGSVARETNLIWQKRWYYSLGVEALISIERDKSRVGNPLATYYIAAAPASLTYDGSDDLLDPHRGFRLTGRASPELSLEGSVFGYVKFQADATKYLPLSDRITLAARGHVGAIVGATQRNIAPTRRFYSGGGGSVRGFGFQAVGPKDPDGSPLGGNAVTEASVEARFRFGDFGVVPFIDVGQVDTATIPRFDSLRVGAGIGARYYTSFGPVRIDIATPVTRERGDAVVQFYVSIGQAF